jgi:serralysin
VIESCLALWSAVTNVDFNVVEDPNDAMLTFKRNNSGSAYSATQTDSGPGAGQIGGDVLSVKTGNLISIDTSVPGFGPIDGDFTAFGGYVWGTVVHELGHSLGLGHAGAYNGFVNPNTQQFSAYDTLLWSIMSYIGPDENSKYDDQYPVNADWGTSPDGYGNTATTWMPLDILAVQQLYGVAIDSPLNGGQTFGFNCDVGGDLQNFFDFTVNVNPVITIYSQGTDNTLDLSGFKQDADINLNPGTFTSCDGKVGNIAIAFGTVIETAIGGRGNDTILGTELDNTLIGNKGNDTFTGGLGGDTMDGGQGTDTFKYTKANQSSSTSFDTLVRFDFDGADRFDVKGAISDIDAAVDAELSSGSFDADLAGAIGGGELGAGHAVLVSVVDGNLSGSLFIVIDQNGNAGYQSGKDLVMLLDNAQNTGAINAADFI